MRVITKKLLVVIGLGMSVSSHAGDWSVGVLAGQTTFDQLDDIACFGGFSNLSVAPGADLCPNDNDGTALGINIGYQLTDIFGFEAGYVNLDEYQSDIIIGGDALGGEVLVKPEALYLAATSSLSLTDRLALTGRLGYYDLDVEISADFLGFGSRSDTVSDSDVYAGASLDYAFTDKLTAQLRYDNFDIDAVSLGLKYNF